MNVIDKTRLTVRATCCALFLLLSACAEQPSTDDRSRTPAEIKKVFKENREDIQAIFNDAAWNNPQMKEAKITFSLTIAPSGRVSDCHIVSTNYHWPALEEVLIRNIKQMNFGARNVEPYIYPDYTINFSRKRPDPAPALQPKS